MKWREIWRPGQKRKIEGGLRNLEILFRGKLNNFILARTQDSEWKSEKWLPHNFYTLSHD